MNDGRFHSQAQPSPASLESTSSNPTPKRVIKRTPAQLAKKRAQDREAQRVSRERTKALIAEQEQQLKQLTAENELHNQQLQTALREKEIAQAEVYELQERLNTTEKILQELNSRLASAAGILNPGYQGFGYSTSANHDGKRSACPPDNNNVDATSHHGSIPQAARDSASYQVQYTSTSASVSGSEHWQPENNTAPIRYSSTGPLLPPIINSVCGSAGGYFSKVLQQPIPLAKSEDDDNSLPTWSIRTKLTPSTCPLDGILLSFVASRRYMLEQGESELAVAGPAQPSMAGLLRLDTEIPIHAMSQVLTDVITKIESVSQLPEKVGALWVMSQVLRWQISSTQENYGRLPEWMRPLACQNTVPHPIWMDYVPWPQMRDKISNNHLKYDQNEFFLPYVEGLSVNWPYKPMDCVVILSTGKEALINPTFEMHVRNLNNWSLGNTFAAAYPSLLGTYRLKKP